MNFRFELAQTADRLEADRVGATRCRHGYSEPHWYGEEDEPTYKGGPIHDVAYRCDGKPE